MFFGGNSLKTKETKIIKRFILKDLQMSDMFRNFAGEFANLRIINITHYEKNFLTSFRSYLHWHC